MRTFQQLTFGSTVNTDASQGNCFYLTATTNFTLANPTNPSAGQEIVWVIKQGGIGSMLITLDSKFRLGVSVASVVLTITAGKSDHIKGRYHVVDDKWDIVEFVKGF